MGPPGRGRTPQTIRKVPPAQSKAILVVEDADADGCSGGLFVGGLRVRHSAGLSADPRGAKRRRPRVPSVLQVDAVCARHTLARSACALAVTHCPCTRQLSKLSECCVEIPACGAYAGLVGGASGGSGNEQAAKHANVGVIVKCSAECSQALCPVLDQSWERVLFATKQEAQADERNSSLHAGCTQESQCDEGREGKEERKESGMNEAGGVHLQQAGGQLCVGEKVERTSEARTHKGESAARTHKGESAASEQGSQERSQGRFMSTLALSTLCPSDCEESLQDEEEGGVQGCRPSEGGSQHSVDVFDSFWSRPVRVPSRTKSRTPATAVSQAEDVCGSCEHDHHQMQACVGVCRFGAMRAPAGDLTQAMCEEGRGCSSDRQHFQAGVGICDVTLDLTLQPTQMAPFVCLGLEQGKSGRAKRETCAREANRSSSGSGFGGLGHTAKKSSEWVKSRLSENEIVMETLLLGQRVLHIISADPGQCWPWLHLSSSHPSLYPRAILCECPLHVQIPDCMRCFFVSLSRARALALSLWVWVGVDVTC